MEATYTLKSKLSDAVTNRLQEVYDDEFSDKDSKTMSFRISAEGYEKVSDVAMFLKMSKSDLLRMVVLNALDDIMREYNLSIETIGLSHAESDELIEKLESGKFKLVDVVEGDNND